MGEIPIHNLGRVINQRVDQTVKAIKVALFNGVIRDTRVDTGRLRGNWQTTNNSMPSGETERQDPTPQGSDGGSAQIEAAFTVKSDTIDYLTNNLPYAEVYERKDGMIARNVERLDRTIREIIK